MAKKSEATPTLVEFRRKLKLDEFQKELLEQSWDHFRNNGEWPILRALYSQYKSREKVRMALAKMTGNVGRDERGSKHWRTYRLSLLGVLLTKEGLNYQNLLTRFFSFQRDCFLEQPLKSHFSAAEVRQALKLTDDQVPILGQLLALGHLGDYILEDAKSQCLALRNLALDLLKNDPATKENPYFHEVERSINNLEFFKVKESIRKAAELLQITVSNEELAAWGYLRNRLAHGDFSLNLDTVDAIQSEFDRGAQVANIVNKFILALIGYRGVFRDYSFRGHPVRNFPSDATTSIQNLE